MPARRFLPLALVVVLSAFRAPSASAQTPPPTPPADPDSAQSRTLREMRIVGTALFSWLVDQVDATTDAMKDPKEKPACVAVKKNGTCKDLHIDRLPRVSAQELARLLVPQYIEAIPEKDGWGVPYEYRVERTHILNQNVMAIRSSGGDRTFSGDHYLLGTFSPAEEDQDLVWLDGFFIRWPGRVPDAPK